MWRVNSQYKVTLSAPQHFPLLLCGSSLRVAARLLASSSETQLHSPRSSRSQVLSYQAACTIALFDRVQNTPFFHPDRMQQCAIRVAFFGRPCRYMQTHISLLTLASDIARHWADIAAFDFPQS
ncbi:hypothetical protein A0H81_12528 [Grifola frondosa]|uniref:Uncharacterized protein n=1 Tax=Grifola frondosa TaxID=5627 RepID=A0A1C7LT89_GRIFR|nr:hypothetical protein A0H81_12528 [Grifola frondosa]